MQRLCRISGRRKEKRSSLRFQPDRLTAEAAILIKKETLAMSFHTSMAKRDLSVKRAIDLHRVTSKSARTDLDRSD
jgi:DNA-nicking Smr family endonuclease